jgi:cytochrome c oxidase assembly factor CtaG
MLLLHLPSGDRAASSLTEALLGWSFEPQALLPWIALGLLYARGWALRRRARHPERGWRVASFLGGYGALCLALLSPLHGFAEDLFSAHMLQHLLLMSVATPLLLLANPLPTALWGLPTRWRRSAGRLLVQDGPLVAALKALTRPLVAWWVFVLVLFGWHLPALYGLALESEPLHYLQHASFLAAAALFWWPVIGPAPLRSRLPYLLRLLYVFATWIPSSALGAGITFAPSVLIPHYLATPRHWGLDPLTDQQRAGLLMWVPSDAIFALAMIILFVALLRQEERQEQPLAPLSSAPIRRSV